MKSFLFWLIKYIQAMTSPKRDWMSWWVYKEMKNRGQKWEDKKGRIRNFV